MAETAAQRHHQLRGLNYHWTETDGGAAYFFSFRDGHYVAARADTGRELTADTADALRALLVSDYAEHPIERSKAATS